MIKTIPICHLAGSRAFQRAECIQPFQESEFDIKKYDGISNALTEEINSKIETIKRAACGYRNKENFRTAILFHCGKLNMLPEIAKLSHH